MGVDVIVGGHPHVVQPVELLQSVTNPEHKTVCIYSLGNAISNQRVSEMRLKTGHTEDGILFNFTLVKYIDGTVELLETSCVPTWVYMVGNKQSYTIFPLDYSLMEQWQENFQIDDATFTACVDSYSRTMELVGQGLEKAQAWFDALFEAKHAILSDPNWKPELPTEPTEVTEATEPTEITQPTEITEVTEVPTGVTGPTE
jgi:hypothetical protein